MYLPIDFFVCKTIVFLVLVLIFTITDTICDGQDTASFSQVPLFGEQEQPQEKVKITTFSYSHFVDIFRDSDTL